MDCESCETVGITTPATTRRNGEQVCQECAREIDARARELQDLRDTAYDEKGIRK